MPLVKIDEDFNMFYADKGSGEVVVLIHGLGGNHTSFGLQINQLSKHFRCIIPDLRGYGKSDVTDTDYSFKELANDVVSLLKNIGCKKANFVGVSMGGMVTQRIMIDYPEFVNKVVLTCTTPINSYNGNRVNIDFVEEMDFDIDIIANFAGDIIYPGDKNIKLREQYVLDYKKNHSQTFRKNYEQIQLLDFRDELSGCSKKTLVIHGNDDPLVNIGFAHLLMDLLKNAILIEYEDVGHTPHRNKPQIYNKDIINFLKVENEGKNNDL